MGVRGQIVPVCIGFVICRLASEAAQNDFVYTPFCGIAMAKSSPLTTCCARLIQSFGPSSPALLPQA
jgi:hypothetical protein